MHLVISDQSEEENIFAEAFMSIWRTQVIKLFPVCWEAATTQSIMGIPLELCFTLQIKFNSCWPHRKMSGRGGECVWGSGTAARRIKLALGLNYNIIIITIMIKVLVSSNIIASF